MSLLTTLVKSQLLRLWRSKSSLLVALLGPLLIVILAGLAFDNSAAFGIRVGTYAPQINGLTLEVIETLKGNQIQVDSFDSEDECVAAVRSGVRHACLVFPGAFSLASEENEVDLIIDGSNLALVGLLSQGLYESIDNASILLSANLTKQLVKALDTVRQKATDGKTSIVQLTTTYDNAVRALGGGRESLDTLDVTVDVSGISVSSLQEDSKAVLNATTSIVNSTKGLLENTLDDLGDLRASVNGSNATTAQQENIIESIDGIVEIITGAIADVDALNGTLNDTDVGASLIVLSDQISRAKGMVENLGSQRAAVADKLSQAHTDLTDALVSITTLQQTLDAIEKAVAGVTITDPALISQPIIPVVRPLPVKSGLASVYPALLVLVVAFGGLLLSPRLVHMERHSSASLRLSLVPNLRGVQALATVCTGLMLVAIQSVVVILVASLFFSQTIGAPLSSLVVLVLTGLLFVILGNAVSYLFAREEAALLATLTLGTVLLVLSDIIIPVAGLPGVLQSLVDFNPVLVAASVIRQTAVFDLSLAAVAGLYVLLVSIAVAAFLGWLSLRFSRHNSVEALLDKVHKKK